MSLRGFEAGYEPDNSYGIRHLTDGRTTLVQIIYRDPYNLAGGPQVVGQGASKRRKGDARNPQLGSALAFLRAHQSAVEYYQSAVYAAEHGTLSQQMAQIDQKVAAEVRKAEAAKKKEARRSEARRRFLSLNPKGWRK
jgi:hypothetical protein